MSEDEALHIIVEYLKTDLPSGGSYGYDAYIPGVMRWHYSAQGIYNSELDRTVSNGSPIFMAAAWELCRMGILRPGVTQFQAQGTDDGRDGTGFSLTKYGKEWIEEDHEGDYVPTDPSRFSEIVQPYGDTFGSGFLERANQAIKCYKAHAYLACCAMCGAATESVLLHLAIQKKEDEEEILKMYKQASGRSKVNKFLMGQQSQSLQRQSDGFLELIKYWRDEAAHGAMSNISENEAYTSLALLLRYIKFASDHYAEIVN